MALEETSEIEARNLFHVNGLVAVITGGGSGIGRMMARAFAANGAFKVFIIGRREDTLKQTASSVGGEVIVPVVGDVTSKDSLRRCVDQVKQLVGSIDVLVANAGASGPSVPMFDSKQQALPVEDIVRNMWETSMEAVTSTYETNLSAVHFTVAAFLPLLHEANGKRPQPPSLQNFKPRPQIITTGSVGAYKRTPLGNLSYPASKAGVIHFTKQLATTLVSHNIRANVIAPGFFYSEMTHDMFKAQGKLGIQNIEGTFPTTFIPATRAGDEKDMAGVILWLCSRAGAYINGCTVVADGGLLSIVPSSY